MSADRDAVVVRRGLRAGLWAWAAGSAVLIGASLIGGDGGGAGLSAVLFALVLGALVSSAWLLLAAVLDLLADDPPGLRRMAWTAGVVVFTFLSPMLALASLG